MEIREAQTSRRERVDLWRPIHLAAVAAQIAVAEIIRDDQDDVRRTRNLRDVVVSVKYDGAGG